jgi:hypothetical protein
VGKICKKNCVLKNLQVLSVKKPAFKPACKKHVRTMINLQRTWRGAASECCRRNMGMLKVSNAKKLTCLKEALVKGIKHFKQMLTSIHLFCSNSQLKELISHCVNELF